MFATPRWTVVAVLAVFSTARGLDYDDRDEDGILYVNKDWGFTPWGSEIEITNAMFPRSAPANLSQTWRLESNPKYSGAVKLTCSKIRLPQMGNGDCSDWLLIIETEEGSNNTYCGWENNLVVRSKNIHMILKTGPSDGGIVDCKAVGIEIGEDGEEVTLPPTTTPQRPTYPPYTTPRYLGLESEEIDSSEHGGPPGVKNMTCPCGWANKKSLRIIGGKETDMHEYPFNVGLTYEGWAASSCGGAIISPYFVLTAAHCVIRSGPGLQVAIAKHNFGIDKESEETRRIIVEKIIIHEKYEAEKRYDIALLLLAEMVEYSKLVGPVCIPVQPLELAEQYVKGIGWGRTTPHGSGSPFLKEVNLRVVPFETCAQMSSNVITTDRVQMCTYSKRQGIGLGDSGGPLVWLNPETNRYTVVGLPALVYMYDYENGASNRIPDIFTDVSRLSTWIIIKMKENQREGYPCWAWDY